jgi:hypothetical protein
MFEKLKEKGFQILTLHHAEAILTHDMADAVAELEKVLLDVEIPVEELIRGGGGEGELTQRMRRAWLITMAGRNTTSKSRRSWMEKRRSLSRMKSTT